METPNSLPDTVLQSWDHAPQESSVIVVLPDGCRDLILRTSAHNNSTWFISHISNSSYHVNCYGNEQFTGYRLKPGAIIDEKLTASLLKRKYQDESHVLSMLDDFVKFDVRLTESLNCLKKVSSIAEASRLLGVTERTLERLVIKFTGYTPTYWKNLARVRRAAQALSSTHSFAAVAFEHGYADQAHMSRDFRQWFGVSPTAFKDDASLMASIMEKGYD